MDGWMDVVNWKLGYVVVIVFIDIKAFVFIDKLTFLDDLCECKQLPYETKSIGIIYRLPREFYQNRTQL